MSTSKYLYLGSVDRKRSHGPILDILFKRLGKTQRDEKRALLLSTLEAGELLKILGLDNVLLGLWRVHQENYSKNQIDTVLDIKRQFAEVALSNSGYSLMPRSVLQVSHVEPQQVSPSKPNDTPFEPVVPAQPAAPASQAQKAVSQKPEPEKVMPAPPAITEEPASSNTSQRGVAATSKTTPISGLMSMR
ncbi:hypothetical protein [Cellvibrio sp. QJXJ]|uniref:hypothetical protein n=1 Tax=Cellvibrio sp. QJXJ TaxID=2964606 RepID=UPI0021C2991C|nr:hypothetical protein [Cellvibrio sp. QJXJ]UUA75135.1 hypothetical protein NNX04_22015 [Cellvibrio sp. QJXJ]